MIDPADIQSARILIVDDCPDTACTLYELLRWKGYQHVSWATDAKAVPGLAAANRYDLIMLDMHMPGMSGLEVMRSLHGIDTAYGTPVIAMSGDQRYGTVSVAAGACAFLMKPFGPEKVEAAICDALCDASPPPALLPGRQRDFLPARPGGLVKDRMSHG